MGADVIAAIGMQLEFTAVTVSSLADVLAANVFDPTDQIAHFALRNRAAEIAAEAEVRPLDVSWRHLIDRKALQNNQPLAGFYLGNPAP